MDYENFYMDLKNYTYKVIHICQMNFVSMTKLLELLVPNSVLLYPDIDT